MFPAVSSVGASLEPHGSAACCFARRATARREFRAARLAQRAQRARRARRGSWAQRAPLSHRGVFRLWAAPSSPPSRLPIFVPSRSRESLRSFPSTVEPAVTASARCPQAPVLALVRVRCAASRVGAPGKAAPAPPVLLLRDSPAHEKKNRPRSPTALATHCRGAFARASQRRLPAAHSWPWPSNLNGNPAAPEADRSARSALASNRTAAQHHAERQTLSSLPTTGRLLACPPATCSVAACTPPFTPLGDQAYLNPGPSRLVQAYQRRRTLPRAILAAPPILTQANVPHFGPRRASPTSS